jgi:hypothetical protein
MEALRKICGHGSRKGAFRRLLAGWMSKGALEALWVVRDLYAEERRSMLHGKYNLSFPYILLETGNVIGRIEPPTLISITPVRAN